MANRLQLLIGAAGVPPGDNERAYRWERRLHWLMMAIALLAIPTYYLDEIASAPILHTVGEAIDLLILLAFSIELGWMLYVVDQKRRYLLHNWLDVLIIASCAASLSGVGTQWVVLARVFRLSAIAMVLLRVMSSARRLFSPDRLPYLLAFGVATMLLGGAVFYWLEPTVKSFGEGAWLAFTTAATVGYGDLVPTTATARVFAVLLVIVGYSMLGTVTASIAAIFIGEDEKRLKRDMHQDIQKLRHEVDGLKQEIAMLRKLLEKNLDKDNSY